MTDIWHIGLAVPDLSDAMREVGTAGSPLHGIPDNSGAAPAEGA